MKLREVLHHRSTGAINRSLEPGMLILNLGSGYVVYQVKSKPLALMELYTSPDVEGVEAYVRHLQQTLPTFTLDPDAWTSTD